MAERCPFREVAKVLGLDCTECNPPNEGDLKCQLVLKKVLPSPQIVLKPDVKVEPQSLPDLYTLYESSSLFIRKDKEDLGD